MSAGKEDSGHGASSCRSVRCVDDIPIYENEPPVSNFEGPLEIRWRSPGSGSDHDSDSYISNEIPAEMVGGSSTCNLMLDLARCPREGEETPKSRRVSLEDPATGEDSEERRIDLSHKESEEPIPTKSSQSGYKDDKAQEEKAPEIQRKKEWIGREIYSKMAMRKAIQKGEKKEKAVTKKEMVKKEAFLSWYRRNWRGNSFAVSTH